MFKVIDKSKNEQKSVYAVSYKKGYPFFTFYDNGQWITRSAKHYKPTK